MVAADAQAAGAQAAAPANSTGPAAASTIEAWLAELGLPPAERLEREGTASWDLLLDGRRRFDVRVTVILDPTTGVIVWAHLAPPIVDSFRRSYRRLLRWSDEIPFVKFTITEDERPAASVEIPADRLDRDELAVAIVRVLAVSDLLLEETAPWIWIGGRVPDWSDRECRQAGLFAAYAGRLGELGGPR